jgi:type II secretory pathway component GspD/PulD (secretin)
LSLLEDLDIAPTQVSVRVEVVDYSPSNQSDLGFSWNWTRFGFYETAAGTGVTGATGGELTDFTTRPAGFGSFSRVPFTFQSVLKAMVEKKEAKILATPHVQAIDNVDANVFIGETIRSQISQGNGISGQTVQVVEFPVGIILLLRPRVNVDGDITMRVHPVVSTIVGLSDDNLPQTSTREAETTIRVKDGETVVIAGLIREEMTKTIRSVPILSEIPLLGELFKSRSTSGRKSEILVFITPTIIKDDEASEPPVAETDKVVEADKALDKTKN